MKNPYTLTFGKEPTQNISRIAQRNEVIETFEEETIPQQVYMITGVRGIGKTVFMTDISAHFKKDDKWIVIELNPESDLLTALAAKLSSDVTMAKWFKTSKINLTAFGFGVEIENTVPINDIETALSKMIESIKKKNKRLLITIDEVTSTPEMRKFASAFQIFIRNNLPVFLLMTGLYENLYELKNEKSLTFLYRSPRIELGPLNMGTIADNYRKNFKLDQQDALIMAKLTKGYSFAFQVLGYLTWRNNGNYTEVRQDYKQYLEEYVYEKIWSELSPTDRQVAYAIATTDSTKISDIRETLDMSTNQFNPYRQRLIRKGVINGSEFGHVMFSLPLFDEFVKENFSVGGK